MEELTKIKNNDLVEISFCYWKTTSSCFDVDGKKCPNFATWCEGGFMISPVFATRMPDGRLEIHGEGHAPIMIKQ